jgi:hypothetical protein
MDPPFFMRGSAGRLTAMRDYALVSRATRLVEGLSQLLAPRVGNGVHNEVEASPLLLDLAVHALDVGVLVHVTAQYQLG